jgi:uncharacterized protein (UPF0332 family)
MVNVFGRDVVSRGVMDKAFSDIMSAALRGRVSSTCSIDAYVTKKDAQTAVESARRFLAKARSTLNYQ